MLNVIFSRKAEKFIEKSESILVKRFLEAIDSLQQNPFSKDAKRVENQWFENEKVFRIRVGDYRILYTVNYQKNRILIVDIDKRSRIY